MAQVGEKALNEVTKLVADHAAVLNALDVSNASNAVLKIAKLKAELEEARGQVKTICEALSVDNWMNAWRKGQKLAGKQD